jgi:hypothetical protein
MRKSTLGALAALATIALFPAAAMAVNPAVEDACTDDYFKFCSQHDPDGSGVRTCMRAHSKQLSKRCVKALVDSGEAKAPVRVARRHKN